MERREFEESLKRALGEAESNPSDHVWNSLELRLEKEKGAALRRQLMFYQLLAAACVVFAAGISFTAFFTGRDTTSMEQPLAQQQPSSEVAPATEFSARPNTTDQESTPETAAKSVGRLGDPVNVRRNTLPVASLERVRDDDPDGALAILAARPDRPLPALTAGYKIVFKKPAPAEPDPVALMLAKLQQRQEELQADEKKKEKLNSENLWTSVGFSAGSFKPVNAGVAAEPASLSIAANSSSIDQEAKASGSAYSMGINIGGKLSERWVLQGGVNYLAQSAEFTARNAFADEGFTNFRPFTYGSLKGMASMSQADGGEKLVATAPYDINNDIRYLSVPVQAGYLVIDRSLGVQVSAGVATDLFLQNTVTAKGERLDQTRQRSGDDSAYRPINFSALFGTELSYKFGESYRISINPGLRYPFNSVYRSNLDVRSTPLTFDVGLRFRYIFR